MDNFDSPQYDNSLVDDFYPNESSYSFQPQHNDGETFKIRNDPAELLERYKLQLMNAYKEKVITPGKDGQDVITFKIKRKKNTRPKANKQGVEDIISYVEKFINGHTVQGNIESMDEYRNKMRHIANDITCHFMGQRKLWGIDINEIDSVSSNAINLIDIFLTRLLFNEERKGYGEGFKEVTSRDIKPMERPSIFQKVGSFLAGDK